MAAKKTAEVFAGFTVVIEDAAGQRRGSLTPEEFRTAAGCSKTAFLADCVESWNARQAREGAEDRARIDMETRSSKREAAQFQRGRRVYEAGKRRGHAAIKEASTSTLLIARKGGRSASRRQRRFGDTAEADRAIARWAKEGFDGFWIQPDGEPMREFTLDARGHRVYRT